MSSSNTPLHNEGRWAYEYGTLPADDPPASTIGTRLRKYRSGPLLATVLVAVILSLGFIALIAYSTQNEVLPLPQSSEQTGPLLLSAGNLQMLPISPDSLDEHLLYLEAVINETTDGGGGQALGNGRPNVPINLLESAFAEGKKYLVKTLQQLNGSSDSENNGPAEIFNITSTSLRNHYKYLQMVISFFQDQKNDNEPESSTDQNYLSEDELVKAFELGLQKLGDESGLSSERDLLKKGLLKSSKDSNPFDGLFDFVKDKIKEQKQLEKGKWPAEIQKEEKEVKDKSKSKLLKERLENIHKQLKEALRDENQAKTKQKNKESKKNLEQELDSIKETFEKKIDARKQDIKEKNQNLKEQWQQKFQQKKEAAQQRVQQRKQEIQQELAQLRQKVEALKEEESSQENESSGALLKASFSDSQEEEEELPEYKDNNAEARKQRQQSIQDKVEAARQRVQQRKQEIQEQVKEIRKNMNNANKEEPAQEKDSLGTLLKASLDNSQEGDEVPPDYKDNAESRKQRQQVIQDKVEAARQRVQQRKQEIQEQVQEIRKKLEDAQKDDSSSQRGGSPSRAILRATSGGVEAVAAHYPEVLEENRAIFKQRMQKRKEAARQRLQQKKKQLQEKLEEIRHRFQDPKEGQEKSVPVPVLLKATFNGNGDKPKEDNSYDDIISKIADIYANSSDDKKAKISDAVEELETIIQSINKESGESEDEDSAATEKLKKPYEFGLKHFENEMKIQEKFHNGEGGTLESETVTNAFKVAEYRFSKLREKIQEALDSDDIEIEPGSAEAFYLEFIKPHARAKGHHICGTVLEEITRDLSTVLNFTTLDHSILFKNLVDDKLWMGQIGQGGNCWLNSQFRTIDGSCNNRNHTRWGAAFTPYRRNLPPAYADAISHPRTGVNGSLPSPRVVSRIMYSGEEVEESNTTLVTMLFGLFVDHDITNTASAAEDSFSSCCGLQARSNPACFPIYIPGNDPLFGPLNKTCMEFFRSSSSCRAKLGPREQLNQVTSFIDGSLIYGSSEENLKNLRLFQNGLMKTSSVNGIELMPQDGNVNSSCGRPKLQHYCFYSGDIRSNEQAELIVMHTVWLREHNRVAVQLKKQNPHWSDERLFQMARKITAAELQHITYNEYLPVILGTGQMFRWDLVLLKEGYFPRYNPDFDPRISNVFSASAFRFGHSQVQSFIEVVHSDRKTVQKTPLQETFFDPGAIYSEEGLDAYIRGFLLQKAQAVDTTISVVLRDHLFERNAPYGLDLPALTIQRARDHGIPGYTAWRSFCGLKPIKNWNDLSKIMDDVNIEKLHKLYKSVDDIDLSPGALSERHISGSQLGPTFSCLIAEQFARLRKGDRFWYENGGHRGAFTQAQLTEIRKASLARILCDNSDNLKEVQRIAFRPASEWNEVVKCLDSSLPSLDFAAWKEEM